VSPSFSKPIVWVLLALGIFLRFHALDRQSLWDDEMSTIHTISTPAGGLLQRFATYETHPPLYFLQLRLWSALNLHSLVKLRANSAFWGSLSLLLAYIVGCFYGGEAMGLLTLAFLTLSPFHLAYSQEMRSYAMAMAIGLAALWALERRAWIPLGFLWTAQLYTHYWGAFVVAAQALYGITSVSSTAERKKVLIAFFSASGAFALWLPILAAQLGIIDQLVFWVQRFSVANLGKVFLAFSGILFNMASWTFYLPAQVWVLGAIGLLFAIVLIAGFRQGPRAAVFWLTIGLGVPWLLSFWKPSIFLWYRYTVHMLPPFALLIASGLTNGGVGIWALDLGKESPSNKRPLPNHQILIPPFLRCLLIITCLGSQAWGDWIYFHGWQKANPKAVVQYVHWLRRSDTIVVRPAYFSDLYNFYDQRTTETVDEHVFDSPEKRAALKGRSIILVAFDVPSDPVADAFLTEFKPLTARVFPGTAHLGVTVYQLK